MKEAPKKLLSVRVPATSANIGSGFDCMGIALNLWNEFELWTAPGQEEAILVESFGEAAERMPRDRSNAIARILFEELEESLGREVPGPLRIVSRCSLPCGSGLGSSSTAVIAGLIFAHALGRPDLNADNIATLRKAVLNRAVEIEGHGDNVAPALLGGLVCVIRTQTGRTLAQPLPCAVRKVVVCTPDFHFLTVKARAVLPPTLPRADAVFNIGHAVLTVEALRSGDLRLLGKSLDDRLHEPYRLPAIPGALDAREAALDAGAAAVCLSGAGPSLLAFAEEGHEQIAAAMVAGFASVGMKAQSRILEVATDGTEITLG